MAAANAGAAPPPRVLVDYPWLEVTWERYSGFWQIQAHSFDNHVRALHFIQRCISIDGPRVTKCPAQTKLLHGSAGKPKRDAAAAASSSGPAARGVFRHHTGARGASAAARLASETSPTSSGAGHRPAPCRPPQAHSTAIQLITTGDQTHARSCLRDWHATYVGTSGCQKGTFVLTSQFENLGNICAFFKVIVSLHPDNIAHPGHYPLYVERPSPRSKKADKTPYEPLWLSIDDETMVGDPEECDRAFEAFYETAVRRPLAPADSSPAASGGSSGSNSTATSPTLGPAAGSSSAGQHHHPAAAGKRGIAAAAAAAVNLPHVPPGSSMSPASMGSGEWRDDAAAGDLKTIRNGGASRSASSLAHANQASPTPKSRKASQSRRKQVAGAAASASGSSMSSGGRMMSAPRKTPQQARTGGARPSKAKARARHASGATARASSRATKPKIKRVHSATSGALAAAASAAGAAAPDAKRPRFTGAAAGNARARVHAASPEASAAPAPSPSLRGPPGGFGALESLSILSPTLHGVPLPFGHAPRVSAAPGSGPGHLSALRRNSLPTLPYSVGPPGGVPTAGQAPGRAGGYLVGLQSPRAPVPPSSLGGMRCAPLCVSAPESPSLGGQANPMGLPGFSGGGFLTGFLPFSPSPRSNVFPSIAPRSACGSSLSTAPQSAMNRSGLEGIRLLATIAASQQQPPPYGSCSGSPSVNSAMSTPALGSPLTSPAPASAITPPTPTRRLQAAPALANLLPSKAGGPLLRLGSAGAGLSVAPVAAAATGPAGSGLPSPHPRFDELLVQARRLLSTTNLTQQHSPSAGIAGEPRPTGI